MSLKDEEMFTPDLAIQKIEHLGLIIDLAYTDRYYNPVILSLPFGRIMVPTMDATGEDPWYLKYDIIRVGRLALVRPFVLQGNTSCNIKFSSQR
ncbi:hypothetical protein QYM36_009345 [Artemia franciscana]|uniref:Uncharacterized protein n=1 Tax=Artemia franciscana TaxID=6661 RepID=A0AA88HK89_ARTSF|nr:hypothetical protein QYM36_009345 [Artemia franciscana]